jgi:hypothetical protein
MSVVACPSVRRPNPAATMLLSSGRRCNAVQYDSVDRQNNSVDQNCELQRFTTSWGCKGNHTWSVGATLLAMKAASAVVVGWSKVAVAGSSTPKAALTLLRSSTAPVNQVPQILTLEINP